jgi:hypothetical protein
VLGRLTGGEVRTLEEEHLLGCESCLTKIESEVAFVELLRFYYSLRPKKCGQQRIERVAAATFALTGSVRQRLT